MITTPITINGPAMEDPLTGVDRDGTDWAQFRVAPSEDNTQYWNLTARTFTAVSQIYEVPVIVFGRQAEYVGLCVKENTTLIVHGSLQFRPSDTEDTAIMQIVAKYVAVSLLYHEARAVRGRQWTTHTKAPSKPDFPPFSGKQVPSYRHPYGPYAI